MYKNKMSEKKSTYFATILIFVSIALLTYGLILDINNEKRLFDPIDDVVSSGKDENYISITTVDGTEVVPNNKVTDKDKNELVKSEENNASLNEIQNESTSNDTNRIKTIEEANNNLRNSIQETYGISIKYGKETYGYSVGGFDTNPLDNSTVINAALNRLNNTLSLYPNGLFYEIKNGGIPLTVILINSYSDHTITGITDSSSTYADISIALEHPFEDSFYHESYHYIERYLLKKGANFNSWNSLNPSGFKYGTIINSYSYDNTFSDSSFFVNNYAQTMETEDRASTFEYMMADSKASCLNNGMNVWKKAYLIKNTIEAVLNSVKPSTVEYWERHI